MAPTSSVSIPEAIETRLTKQEQTLSHILTRLDQLTAPTTTTPIPQPVQKSWANIVEQAAPPTTSTTTKASKKRPEPTPEPERTIILKPTTPPTSLSENNHSLKEPPHNLSQQPTLIPFTTQII